MIELVELQRESLIDLLREILEAAPDGIREYDLLRQLEERGIACFLTGHHENPLILFRSHFLLFHLLYGLRARLRATGSGDLEIHCLRIVLQRTSMTPSRELPGPCDSLQDYYGNLENLWNTSRDDVIEMMVNFWRHYERFCLRSYAFEVFGLPENATAPEIKRRFRELVRQTHPDLGGSSDSFHRVMRAAATLLP